ncbi:Serine/threonine protein kinase [Phytophthora palmivora]|uniref:Serine/threonine protein kinase n=1 Tax=Phytophthora palmivora TaxID=4796 RepID=A0A2P4YP13_9STRA|nr:Serine/threonine protein kinase [Phytophthora palmivora]
MFFDENGGLFEQSVRLMISIGTYLVPNWGVLYVFYVLPRFQFSTVLDVPGLLLDDENEEAAYELLPAEVKHLQLPKTQLEMANDRVGPTVTVVQTMDHDSVRLLRPAPPTKSPLDLSAHDIAMVRLGGGSTFQRSGIILQKRSVMEEDIVICNRVRCGVDPSWFQHRNSGDHRYLRALSFEEARLAATRRRRSISMAAACPKKSQSMRINTSVLGDDEDEDLMTGFFAEKFGKPTHADSLGELGTAHPT